MTSIQNVSLSINAAPTASLVRNTAKALGQTGSGDSVAYDLASCLVALETSHQGHEASDAAALVATRIVAYAAANKLVRLWNANQGGKDADKKAFKDTFVTVLKHRVARGKVVYTGTEDECAEIGRIPNKERRNDAVNDYLKPVKGQPRTMVQGLKKPKNYANKILLDLSANAADQIRAIASFNDQDHKERAFTDLLYDRYGIVSTDAAGNPLFDSETGRPIFKPMKMAHIVEHFREDKEAVSTEAKILKTLESITDVGVLSRIAAAIVSKINDDSALQDLSALVLYQVDEVAKTVADLGSAEPEDTSGEDSEDELDELAA